jgi:GTP cyclohydrolase IA
MTIDSGRIEAAVTELLLAIGEDPARPGLQTTPRRVAEAYGEFFGGLGADPQEHLRGAAVIDAGSDGLGELVLLRDIEFRSVCEHHLLPFTGVAHVAYVPRRRIVGLGRIPRVVDTISSRPQLQERLTEQIASALDEGLDPLGVLVVMDARHTCVTSRGVRQAGSTTVTVASRGTLAEPAERAATLALIGGGAGRAAGELDGEDPA